ncbi:MAG TPA: J domain-containing protein [Pseudonocardiaceae bacterium]|nr:J domain-containing protein [Pseudonocardiaceae bacterium]
MSTDHPDPYAVLGVKPDASSAEITAAYRRAVRAYHPDAPHPDRDRLAAVITAYQQLRGNDDLPPSTLRQRSPSSATDIPVRVHSHSGSPPDPDLRAGPVRRLDGEDRRPQPRG